jgi:hypothetical protein
MGGKMKKIVLLSFVLSMICGFLLFPTTKAEAGLNTTTIKASYHNWTDSGYPTYTHYNGQPYMNVGYSPGRAFRSYVYFNLSSIPAGSTINSASFNIWLQNDFFLSNPIDHTDCFGTPSVPVLVAGQVSESWSSSMNWNNQPGHVGYATYDLTQFPCNDQERFYYIGVTQIVKNWVESGQANNGFNIIGTESGSSWSRRFASSTGAEAEKPQLYIQYTTPDAPADPPSDESLPSGTTGTDSTTNGNAAAATTPTVNPNLKTTDSSIATPTLTYVTVGSARSEAPVTSDLPIIVGDSLIVGGKATKGLTISLAIGDKVFSGVVDDAGNWEIVVDTSAFVPGIVKAKAQAQDLKKNKGSAEAELFGLSVSAKTVVAETKEAAKTETKKMGWKDWLILAGLVLGLILAVLALIFRKKIFKIFQKP